MTTTSHPDATPPTLPRKPPLRAIVLGIGLVAAVIGWLGRETIRFHVSWHVLLANEAPNPGTVEDFIEAAPDPDHAAIAAWNTGKIVHRQAASRCLARWAGQKRPWPPELETLALAGALDPDLNVREAALSCLSVRRHPALPAMAAAQLRDLDPEVRLLGLSYLKRVSPEFGVPAVVPVLDDADPHVVAMGLNLLGRWSGENFGVRLADVVAVEDETTGMKSYHPEGIEKTRAGAARARTWWAAHAKDFPAAVPEVPALARQALRPVPAADFVLPDLDGRTVRLSSLRGKVVLLNFWTTWCTACVSEMPALIELQKRHGDRLAILGVSLDFVPDSHGHIGGHAAVEDQAAEHGAEEHAEDQEPTLKQVRAKVARVVKKRGINYPVLLDERNEVGGRFNGGELPTTVIVDPAGNVRRRFVGARSLPVFEAMIREAQTLPPPPLAQAALTH